MNAESFCYWLQGYFEIHAKGDVPESPFTPAQMAMIKEHLQLVFKKVTGQAPPVTATPGGLTLEKILEEINKNRQNPPPFYPPIPGQQDRPWWMLPLSPLITCSSAEPTEPSSVDCQKYCEGTTKIQADGSTITTNNAGGQTHTVQAAPPDPTKPIFIC